jgi:hypothetical protein
MELDLAPNSFLETPLGHFILFPLRAEAFA